MVIAFYYCFLLCYNYCFRVLAIRNHFNVTDGEGKGDTEWIEAHQPDKGPKKPPLASGETGMPSLEIVDQMTKSDKKRARKKVIFMIISAVTIGFGIYFLFFVVSLLSNWWQLACC